MAKASKQFKKFAASGKLQETIKARRSKQQSRRKFEERVTQRSKQRGGPKDEGFDNDDEDDGEDRGRDKALGVGGRAGGVGSSVDALLSGDLGLAGASEEEDEDEDEELDDEDEEDDEEEGDLNEDELARDEEAMKKAMAELQKNDPEFYKYLKENDQDLLEFGDDEEEEDDGDEDEDMEVDGAAGDSDSEDEDMDSDDEPKQKKQIEVTIKMLRLWQEGMVRLFSIRSLHKTLLAFRAAAYMNEEDASEGSGGVTRYTINDARVFNKLVMTALKFTPVVMQHHVKSKTLPNGKFKVTQPKTPNPRLNTMLLRHFSTLLHFIKSLPATSTTVDANADEAQSGGLLLMAIQESGKLLPWIMGARKHVGAYLKVLLELWSTGSDNIRIAAFLAIRKMFEGGDDAIKDKCLKNTYRALLPSLRNTTPHTLPSINLLKNTASELYLLAPTSIAYPHVFNAIRALAVHLRDVIRNTTLGKAGDDGEAFRRVYNWQFVHCLDLWGRVLGGASVRQVQGQGQGKEDGEGLGMLVYPFVQVALGVVRLLPSPRYFPLHFHILHTLLRLQRQTGTYIPLAPYLLDVLSSSEFRPSSNPKKSTLKPLDLEYIIRAPQTYLKTRIYQDVLTDELIFLLGEYHAIVSDNIAFPEISIPVVMGLKKWLKRCKIAGGGGSRAQIGIKGLIERLEVNRKWIEDKRRGVGFAPRDRAEVGRFLKGGENKKGEVPPLEGWMRTQRKVRERKREEVERALREEKE